MNLPILKKLGNGLKVCFLPFKEVESVTVQLRGLAGSNYETLDEIGTAHFLEHWILKGSTSYPSDKILTDLITSGGGKLVGVTSRDDVLFGTHVLKENLEEALIFLSETLYSPLLESAQFQKIKTTLKNETRRYYDNPEKLLSRLSYAALFPDTRLAKFNTGDALAVENLDENLVRKFHKSQYVNDNFILVICGNFDIEQTETFLDTYFAHTTGGTRASNLSLPINSGRLVQVYDKFNFDQCYLRIDLEGFPISSPDKYDCLVLAKVLSQALKSEVHQQGVSYKSSVTSFSARNYGIFSFFGVVNPPMLERFMQICADILTSPTSYVKEEAVIAAKRSLVATILFALEKPSMRAEYYSELILHGSVLQNHVYEIDKIKETNLQTVLNIAQQIFTKSPKFTLISKEYSKNSFEEILTAINI